MAQTVFPHTKVRGRGRHITRPDVGTGAWPRLPICATPAPAESLICRARLDAAIRDISLTSRSACSGRHAAGCISATLRGQVPQSSGSDVLRALLKRTATSAGAQESKTTTPPRSRYRAGNIYHGPRAECNLESRSSRVANEPSWPQHVDRPIGNAHATLIVRGLSLQHETTSRDAQGQHARLP